MYRIFEVTFVLEGTPPKVEELYLALSLREKPTMGDNLLVDGRLFKVNSCTHNMDFPESMSRNEQMELAKNSGGGIGCVDVYVQALNIKGTVYEKPKTDD